MRSACMTAAAGQSGVQEGVLGIGKQKSLQTDRVILVWCHRGANGRIWLAGRDRSSVSGAAASVAQTGGCRCAGVLRAW
jgi:hypothetical protein